MVGYGGMASLVPIIAEIDIDIIVIQKAENFTDFINIHYLTLPLGV